MKKSRHDRLLVLGGSALVRGRLRHSMPALGGARDAAEAHMKRSDFLSGAPFEWIGLIFSYGTQRSLHCRIGRINQIYGDLPLTFELDMEELLAATREELEAIFYHATVQCLMEVGRKFDLRIDRLQAVVARGATGGSSVEAETSADHSSQRQSPGPVEDAPKVP